MTLPPRTQNVVAVFVASLAACAGALASSFPTIYVYDQAGNVVRVSDTATDPSNCGAVGVVCQTPAHSLATCSVGVCGSACVSGWANCNGLASDGCETGLTSLTNCGSCGKECTYPNGTPSCSTGVCGGTCVSGRGDCNGLVADGCEAALTTDFNCGSCGNACTDGLHCKLQRCVDLCVGVRCRTGYVCDPDVGACVSGLALKPSG